VKLFMGVFCIIKVETKNVKIMASENKKHKEKNSNSNHGFALKEKLMKLKRALYYNASKRKELKKIQEWE